MSVLIYHPMLSSYVNNDHALLPCYSTYKHLSGSRMSVKDPSSYRYLGSYIKFRQGRHTSVVCKWMIRMKWESIKMWWLLVTTR